jgi:hypothetical protein
MTTKKGGLREESSPDLSYILIERMMFTSCQTYKKLFDRNDVPTTSDIVKIEVVSTCRNIDIL